MKYKIFCDMDETLTKSICAFVEVYKEIHRLEIENCEIPHPIWEEVSKWNMNDEMPKLKLKELNKIFDSPRLFDHLAFYADSNGVTTKDFIMELLDENDVELFIASKGNHENLVHKCEFIKSKLPFFPLDHFIPMQGTVMDKSALNGLMLLDDNQDNLYSANVKYRILVNFSGEKKEWNDRAMDDPTVYKCFSVSDVINTVYELLEFERRTVV